MEQLLSKDVTEYLKIRKRVNYNKFCKTFSFKPHSTQQTIIDTFQKNMFNYMTLVCGRRWGKTEVISLVGSGEMLIPFSNVLIVTPVFANAKAIFEKIERRLLKQNIPIKTKDMKALTFETAYNSKIVVVTPKSIDSALGFMYSLVIFDEAQSIPNLIDIFENYLEPAMADYGVDEETNFYNAKAVFIGTSRDESNDLFKLTLRARSKKYRGYVHFTMKTEDNPYIPKEFIDSKREELDPITFGREYCGIWSKLNNSLVYYSFDMDKNVIPHREALKRVKDCPLHIAGMDMGYSDNFSTLWAGIEPFTGKIIITTEYRQNKTPLELHHSNMVEKEKQQNIKNIYRFGDPSAPQVMADLSFSYNYNVIPAINDIEEGIQLVNKKFYHGDILVSEECVDLIEELTNMVWKNATEKTVARTATLKHFDLALASLRYMIMSWEIQSGMEIKIV